MSKFLMFLNKLFYNFKPVIPRPLQLFLRRQLALHKIKFNKHIWPIDQRAGKPPDGWHGWPDEKRFALVLIHDVDTEIGQERVLELTKIEEKMGFRSSFNFVPERYKNYSNLRHHLNKNGFEVAVHGLNHDGKLFSSRNVFLKRAIRINHHLEEWKAVGFHSPSMHGNLDWIHDLKIEYDQSTFDTDPFEPQPKGVCTIFPFYVQNNSSHKGYVELPYTLPQDHSLFVVLKKRSIKIWKDKVDWIVEQQGMALLNTHPDYMNFDGAKPALEEYPVQYYEQFLQYIKTKYKGKYWHILPKGMSRFWSTNMMNSRE